MTKEEIDNISLEQALIDVEVANARVIDLSERLTSMGRELHDAREALDALLIIKNSLAFRILRFAGRVKRRLWQ